LYFNQVLFNLPVLPCWFLCNVQSVQFLQGEKRDHKKSIQHVLRNLNRGSIFCFTPHLHCQEDREVDGLESPHQAL
ncbi:hypothetical protein SDJN02_15356, partial [Cucurbita argyrosperma subsp. argyrosperma]